jgi:hypothetical protein
LEASESTRLKGSSRLAALAVVVALAVVSAGLALSSGGARLAYADGDATAQADSFGVPCGGFADANSIGDAYSQGSTNNGCFGFGFENDGPFPSDVDAFATANTQFFGLARATAHAEGDDGNPAFAASTSNAQGVGSVANATSDAQTDSTSDGIDDIAETCPAGGGLTGIVVNTTPTPDTAVVNGSFG